MFMWQFKSESWWCLAESGEKKVHKMLRPSPKNKRREAHSTARSLRKMAKEESVFSIQRELTQNKFQVKITPIRKRTAETWSLSPRYVFTKNHLPSTLLFVGFLGRSFFGGCNKYVFGMPNPSQLPMEDEGLFVEKPASRGFAAQVMP